MDTVRTDSECYKFVHTIRYKIASSKILVGRWYVRYVLYRVANKCRTADSSTYKKPAKVMTHNDLDPVLSSLLHP